MVAKELYLEQQARNEENTLLQDQYEDEEDETLSLCDLPNSTISTQCGDFSKEDGKNTKLIYNHDDDDDNLFEFFSEEFTTPSTHDNIVFCGKLIPFKDHQSVAHNTQKCDLGPKAKPIIGSLKSKEGESSLNIKSFTCDYTTMGGKVSLVRCATKSRWFLFLFGMSSSSRMYSKEMQLNDIRNRQSRREPAAMFPAPENGKEVVKRKKNENSKGMWKMLKSISLVLGCNSSSKLANDVVTAAFV